MLRRRFVVSSLMAVAALAVAPDALAGPRRRRVRRRVRRRIRRRHRRRVVRRMVLGRPVWVVPVGVAIGWELVDQDRVVVVHETRIVEREGVKVEVLVVTDSSGRSEEIEVVREDTPEGAVELEGSPIADTDTTTPGVDAEIEEEIEVDE